jgi:hypothetical protein
MCIRTKKNGEAPVARSKAEDLRVCMWMEGEKEAKDEEEERIGKQKTGGA